MKLTYEQFKNLPRPEYDEFMSKAFQCINQNEYCFLTMQELVFACDKNHMFDKTKFGDDAEKNNSFPMPDMVGLKPLS